MTEKESLHLDLIYCKMGYILACLASYVSLDLSKRINDINQHIHLIHQSVVEQKNMLMYEMSLS